MMSISAIESVGFVPSVTPVLPTTTASVQGPEGPNPEFGDLVLQGIERLQGVQADADQLAVQAATGDLDALHDYTIAATEASVTTQLAVSLRNRAVEAFTEIMRMQV